MILSKRKNSLPFCYILAFAFLVYSLMLNNRAAGAIDVTTCRDCHDDIQSNNYVHDPVEEWNCEACHEAGPEHFEEGGPTGMKTNRTASACYQCHEKKNQGRNVHPALEMEGECVQCHNPHGSDSENFLVMPKNRICFECHDPVPEDAGKGSEHSVVTDDESCLNCHNPHATDQDSLLIQSPKTLCFNCHDREIIIEEDGKTRKIANIKQKILEMEFVHMPAVWCTSCHDSHGSKYRSLLVASFPAGNYNLYEPGGYGTKNTYELCFKCHDQRMLNKTITAGNTGFRNDIMSDGGIIVRENLHWFHVVDAAGSDNKNRGRSCNMCHDPHGSANPHVLRTSWTMKNYNPVLVFANMPNGGECLKSCHSVRRYERID
jgi:predicted CXXCH cytochrome family protein